MHLAPKSTLDDRMLARMDLANLLQEYETRFRESQRGENAEPRAKLISRIREAAKRCWPDSDLEVLEDLDNRALLIQSVGNSKNPITLVLSRDKRTLGKDKAVLNVWFAKRIDSQEERIGPYRVRGYATGLNAISRRGVLKILAGLAGFETLRRFWNTFGQTGPSADVIMVYGEHGTSTEFPKEELEKQARAMDKELSAVPHDSNQRPKAVYVMEALIKGQIVLKAFRKKYPEHARFSDAEILKNEGFHTILKEIYLPLVVEIDKDLKEEFILSTIDMDDAKNMEEYLLGWARARKLIAGTEHASFESWIIAALSQIESAEEQPIPKKNYEGFLREVLEKNDTWARSLAIRDEELHKQVVLLRNKYPGYTIFLTRGTAHLHTRYPFERGPHTFKFYNTQPDWLETANSWFVSELLDGKNRSKAARQRLTVRFIIRNIAEMSFESCVFQNGDKVFGQSEARNMGKTILDSVENRVPDLEEYFKAHFLASDSLLALRMRLMQSFIQLGIIKTDPLRPDLTKALIGGAIAERAL